MVRTIQELGEDAIIALFAAGGARPGAEVTLPNGDDAAAYVPTAGRAQVLTTDCLTEHVHFARAYTPPRSVGRKLMAVNLSDLASMGAQPRYALLSVVLPVDLEVEWLRQVAAGVHDAASAHEVVILGGNVSRSPEALVLDATLVGDIEPTRLVRRRAAQAGDDLWVSGELGAPAAALARVNAWGAPGGDSPDWPLFERWVEPQPRVALGAALAAAGVARAMCDVSDGLARDLDHLLAEGQGCVVLQAALPVVTRVLELARELEQDPATWLVGGGEEYELLFAADPAHRAAIVQIGLAAGCPVSRIGEVEASGPRWLERPDGARMTLAGGFDHFAAGGSSNGS